MNIPQIVKRHLTGGQLYKCKDCGVLIEVNGKSKKIVGYVIEGKVYGLSFANTSDLVDARSHPSHGDCLSMLPAEEITSSEKAEKVS